MLRHALGTFAAAMSVTGGVAPSASANVLSNDHQSQCDTCRDDIDGMRTATLCHSRGRSMYANGSTTTGLNCWVMLDDEMGSTMTVQTISNVLHVMVARRQI